MDKETVHRHKAAYPAGKTPSLYYRGYPILQHSHPSYALPCSHDAHNAIATCFSHRELDVVGLWAPIHFCFLFHVVLALQRIVVAFLKVSLVQGSWEKINSVFFCTWALKFHRLHSEVVPPIADTHRRCRRDIHCLRLVVSHRRRRREFHFLPAGSVQAYCHEVFKFGC